MRRARLDRTAEGGCPHMMRNWCSTPVRRFVIIRSADEGECVLNEIPETRVNDRLKTRVDDDDDDEYD